MVTGYSKIELDQFSKSEIQKTIKAYKNYKKPFRFPKGIKGIYYVVISIVQDHFI